MKKNFIDLVNISKSFSGEMVIDDLNLSIVENSFVTLLGPSGCGKSTILKMIGGFLTPDKGQVFFDGKDITGLSPDKRQLNTVFQKYALFPHMNVYDNIAFGPRTHGITKKSDLNDIVELSLRRAAIWDEVKDRLNKSALGFSGGQQQRLCIARALAVEPEILLMDEPTSALDPISTLKIEDLALELKKQYTIVIVTHNMQQAARISDRTGFFLLGELVEYGITDEIFSNPRKVKTEEYITGRFG